jgi:hypothetical protein
MLHHFQRSNPRHKSKGSVSAGYLFKSPQEFRREKCNTRENQKRPRHNTNVVR